MLPEVSQITRSQPTRTFGCDKALAPDHSNDTPYHGYHVAICKILAQSDEAFDRVAQQRPADGALWIGRAEDRALRSRWSDALAEYAKVILQRPSAGDENTEYAYLLVLLNNRRAFSNSATSLSRDRVNHTTPRPVSKWHVRWRQHHLTQSTQIAWSNGQARR